MAELVICGYEIRTAARIVAEEMPGDLQPKTVEERLRKKWPREGAIWLEGAVLRVAIADIPKIHATGFGEPFVSSFAEKERMEDLAVMVKKAKELRDAEPAFAKRLERDKINLDLPCYPKLLKALKRWK
jgi:hypothetical protein